MTDGIRFYPRIETTGVLAPGEQVGVRVTLDVDPDWPSAAAAGELPGTLDIGLFLSCTALDLAGGDSATGTVRATFALEAGKPCTPIQVQAAIRPDVEPGTPVELVALFFHGTRHEGMLRQAVGTVLGRPPRP